MFIENFSELAKLVERLLQEPVQAEPGNFDHVVRQVLDSREDLLALASRHQTPAYVFDVKSFDGVLREFTDSFAANVPRHRPFYAVKANHHPWVVRQAVAAGFGLDVSSRRELVQALRTGAKRILFSGPAKSREDLQLAADHADRVTVNVDSFGELNLLGDVAKSLDRSISIGVRIHTGEQGAWSKFGIPLIRLAEFWRLAEDIAGIDPIGIQSHLSWTSGGPPHCPVIAALAECLKREFSSEQRSKLRFYDFGGGYRPYRIEGRYPGETPQGEILQLAAQHYDRSCEFGARYYFDNSVPMAEHAEQIGAAIKEHLVPLLPDDCEYFSEPGRVVASRAMHLLLRVVDRKSDDLAIVDGGIHMIGWERYLHTYAPIENLSRPSLAEKPIRICGSLCDPEDMFGFYVHGESVEPGDVLLVPNQGAYSFSTAQNFIRDVPPVIRWRQKSSGPRPGRLHRTARKSSPAVIRGNYTAAP